MFLFGVNDINEESIEDALCVSFPTVADFNIAL